MSECDIITRLHLSAERLFGRRRRDLLNEAADEIFRLRTELARLESLLKAQDTSSENESTALSSDREDFQRWLIGRAGYWNRRAYGR